MYRKWKSVSALGMAVLIGCLVPVGTMMAAEENTEVVQDNGTDPVSVVDDVCEDAVVPEYDDASDGDEAVADDTGGAGGEAVAEDVDDGGEAVAEDVDDGGEAVADDAGDDGDEAVADDVGGDSGEVITGDDGNSSDEAVADNAGNDSSEAIDEIEEAKTETETTENRDISSKRVYAQTESIAAPVIDIRWQGQNRTYGLGGAVDYEYVNNRDQAVYCSVNQAGHAVALYYSLDNVADVTAEAKGNEQMDSQTWVSVAQSSQVEIFFLKDGNYVVYIKAVGEDGQITYARSGGIVVDTVAPKVIGVQEGETYPEGTVFQVEDANLESVTVNEKPVAPAPDGSYQVIANGTSCVIKAKDKAGNDTTCSITVSEKEPVEESLVISKNGTYSLKAGVAYGLAEGKWKLDGESTVYWGGSTFYVRADGDYKFTRR